MNPVEQALINVIKKSHERVRGQSQDFAGLPAYVSGIMKDVGATSSTLYLRREAESMLTHCFTLRMEKDGDKDILSIHSLGADLDLHERKSFNPVIFSLSDGLKFLRLNGSEMRAYSTDVADQTGVLSQLPMPLASQIVAPLYIKDVGLDPKCLGAWVLEGDGMMLEPLRSAQFSPEILELLTMIYVSQISSGISTIISSRNDPLTLLPRRGEFEMRLRAAIEMVTANKVKDVSVIVMDVDHFKDVNDKHGHITGDLVLKEVSRTAAGALRTKRQMVSADKRHGVAISNGASALEDLFARWGGEEFVACLATCPAGAKIAAERIRKRVEALAITISETQVLNVTVSLGIASIKRIIESGITKLTDVEKAVLSDADSAMYAAKAAGRNCTHVFGQ